MDKKKSILNVTVSVGSRLIIMVLAIAVKRSLIRTCGNDVNGLNSLYLSIIGFLTVAELGVGSAISFCMYRPIVEGDIKKVSALYHLFRKWYQAVGTIMLMAGLALMPVLHLFAKDYAQLDVNLHVTLVLILVSVVATYLFGAKTALINAYKNNYITIAIDSGSMVVQYLLQLVVLWLTKSFVAYLACRIITVLIQWYLTNRVTQSSHTDIISGSGTLDRDTRRTLVEKIKAMFIHKVGSLLVNTVDSIVISVFIGVVALGEYSNYTSIQMSMNMLLKLVFTSLMSVVGHMYVQQSREAFQKYHELFHMGNFVLGTVFYLGYFAVIDPLIAILFGEDLVMERTVSMVITMNGFVQFMRMSTLVFRDATGSFYHDRWKPLAEGTVNIVLSVLFVRWIGVTGVIVATIVTNLLICHVVEPFVLFKNAFECSPLRYCLRNYSLMAIFGGLMVLYRNFEVFSYGHWGNMLTNGMISVAISGGVCIVLLLWNGETRDLMVRRLKKWSR